jgi:hypothetical protein
MSTVNLSNTPESIVTSNDSIVIVDNFQSIRGGRSLDATGFTGKVLRAGHVIIKETATGNYKPMPTTEDSAGNVATLGSITAGSAYTNGTYPNIPLLGGSGAGVRATVVVSGNAVTSVTKTENGAGYQAGDVLTVDPVRVGGTGSGFSIPVATISSTTGSYGALPAGHTYAGILIASILAIKPFAGIMVRGTVNPAASPYSLSTILSALQAALPLIDFRQD